MTNTIYQQAKARQIEIALKIRRLEEHGVVVDIRLLTLSLQPLMRELEKDIRAFDEMYVWDLSYPYFDRPNTERKVCDMESFKCWNPGAPTPKPTRQQLTTHFNKQRKLFNYHQKIRNAAVEYTDATRELNYWNRRFGPLKSTPGFKL